MMAGPATGTVLRETPAIAITPGLESPPRPTNPVQTSNTATTSSITGTPQFDYCHPSRRNRVNTIIHTTVDPWGRVQHHRVPNPRHGFPLMISKADPAEYYLLDNARIWAEWENIPGRYLELFKSTKQFVATVERLARLPVNGAWEQGVGMLVEFSDAVLRGKGSCWSEMLNSQRSSIYGILDNALLSLLLEKWNEYETSPGPIPWDLHTQSLRKGLGEKDKQLSAWSAADFHILSPVYSNGVNSQPMQSDGAWMKHIYFTRSREFLEKSVLVWKFDVVTRRGLPTELLDEVVSYVEGFPKESLSTEYQLKGKSKI